MPGMPALSAVLALRPCVVDQVDGPVALVERPTRGFVEVSSVLLPPTVGEGDVISCSLLRQGAEVASPRGARRRGTPVHWALARPSEKE